MNKYLQIILKTAYYLTQDKTAHTLDLSRVPIQTMLCLLVAGMATPPPAASTFHFVRDTLQLVTRPFDELEWFHVAVSTQ